MTEAIEVKREAPDTSAAGIFAMAVDKDLDVEKLERIMVLVREERAENAKKAFHRALREFTEKCPEIVKDKDTTKASAGGRRFAFKYASLPSIKRTVDPVLAECGLSYRFETTREDGMVTVTCVLSHEDGHSERSSFSGPIDKGSMNDIQKVGSGRSYGKRYALEDALGICASDDDDGEGTAAKGNRVISADDAMSLEAMAEEVGADWERFKRFLKVSDIRDLPEQRLEFALSALRRKAEEGYSA